MTSPDFEPTVGDSFFTEEQLMSWADISLLCEGHSEEDIQRRTEITRKIIKHDDFKLFKKTGVEVPDTSEPELDADGVSIPRDLVMDVDLVAKVMLMSKKIDHGLNPEDLEFLYVHSCVELIAKGFQEIDAVEYGIELLGDRINVLQAGLGVSDEQKK